MWVCYFGEITESYRKDWTPHTVRPDEKEPDVHDVIGERYEIGYRLDMRAAEKCFPGWIQVDWGGWAYKVTKEKILQYNEEVGRRYGIPEWVLPMMEDGKEYAVIDVELS